MKSKSSKRQKQDVLRRKFVLQVLTERPGCEACGVFARHDGKAVYVQRAACDVHELVRRSQGGNILDEKNVLAVCRLCHDRIGRYPQLAFDLGLARHGWERRMDSQEPSDAD